MTPLELGKTAAEVVAVVMPALQANTAEVSRMADELSRINGTVRGLCEWRAATQERFRLGDEKPAIQPTENASARRPEDTKELINLVLGWALRFTWAGAALATGLNLAKIAEVLFK